VGPKSNKQCTRADRGYTVFDRQVLAGNGVGTYMTLSTLHVDLCYRLNEQGIKASSTPAMAERRRSSTVEHDDGETSDDQNGTHGFP
jgi:hypothetical protein